MFFFKKNSWKFYCFTPYAICTTGNNQLTLTRKKITCNICYVAGDLDSPRARYGGVTGSPLAHHQIPWQDNIVEEMSQLELAENTELTNCSNFPSTFLFQQQQHSNISMLSQENQQAQNLLSLSMTHEQHVHHHFHLSNQQPQQMQHLPRQHQQQLQNRHQPSLFNFNGMDSFSDLPEADDASTMSQRTTQMPYNDLLNTQAAPFPHMPDQGRPKDNLLARQLRISPPPQQQQLHGQSEQEVLTPSSPFEDDMAIMSTYTDFGSSLLERSNNDPILAQTLQASRAAWGVGQETSNNDGL